MFLGHCKISRSPDDSSRPDVISSKLWWGEEQRDDGGGEEEDWSLAAGASWRSHQYPWALGTTGGILGLPEQLAAGRYARLWAVAGLLW